MLDNSNLLKDLDYIDNLFNLNMGTPQMLFLYQKIAYIESCGWIEQCMDCFIDNMSNKFNLQPFDKQLLTTKLHKTYGFDYDLHFRPLLIYIIGLNGVSTLETKVNMDGSIDRLKGHLTILKTSRNELAHKHTDPSSRPVLYTPSDLKIIMVDIYALLVKIENII
jgi:2-iminobutanoate/2-iminopropanoate deaminase